MNCDDFFELMNERLDARLPINEDVMLCRHAKSCDSCRAQMDAWNQIATVMPREATSVPVSLPKWSMSAIAAVAVALLLAFSIDWHSTDQKISVDQLGAEGSAFAKAGELDPMGWLQQLQQRDWVGDTMPTVESVQRGVAPLGRTLMRAATMLTIGGPSRAS
jgi:hypothetical protein